MKKVLVLIPLLATLLLVACSDGPTSTTSLPATSSASTSPPTVSEPSTTASTTPTTGTPVETGTTATAGATLPTTFTAKLTGAEVVPPVETAATGTATFTFAADGTRAHFVLELSNISGVIASRVHEGDAGSNGRGLLILYPGPDKLGLFNGTLAEANFNASSLIGSLTGKTLSDLAALMASGRAYVNVGTIANRDGEIRGQIR